MVQQESDVDRDVVRFQELLEKCNYAKRIVWLVPDDVLLSGNSSVYVRVPVPACNETNARCRYEEGMARGRGLLLSTVCGMEDATYCYVWYPADEEEGHLGLWPHDGGVKMSAKAKSSRIRGKAVRSRFMWQWYRFRYRRKQDQKDQLFS